MVSDSSEKAEAKAEKYVYNSESSSTDHRSKRSRSGPFLELSVPDPPEVPLHGSNLTG